MESPIITNGNAMREQFATDESTGNTLNHPRIPRSSAAKVFSMTSKINQDGYTLIELLIVLAIIGLLVSIALPQYRFAQQRAKEAVLKENLFRLREVIDQYKSDKGKYPTSLRQLVDEGYLRKMPLDPITERNDSWQEIPEDTGNLNPDPNNTEIGIWDVKSGAEGTSLDGTPYNEL
jgi:general secretion pathway protein G